MIRSDGGLGFPGQHAIISGPCHGFDRFAISVPPQGTGYPGTLATHARAIDPLADRIAATITGRAVS